MRNGVLRNLGVTLAVVAGLTAMVTPGPAMAADARIKSLALRELNDRAELVLQTSRRLEWSARALGEGRIMLTLPETVLDPAVSDLTFPDGLVESVEASAEVAGEVGTTTLLVTLRGARSYSVAVEKKTLRMIIRPKTAEELEAEAAAAAVESGGAAGGKLVGETTGSLGAAAEEVADEAAEEAAAAVGDAGAAMGEARAPVMGAPVVDESVLGAPVVDESVLGESQMEEVMAGERVAGDASAAAAGTVAAEATSAEEELLRSLEPEPIDPTFAAADAESGEYRIGPGDVLEISVFGLDEFDRTVRVLRDGSISLPLLGGLRVAGMSLQEAEAAVATMLSGRQLVNEPQVSFFVKEYVSRGVSIQGAVVKPGVYQMIQQRSLLEMLGEAGGLAGASNNRAGQQIFIIRKSDSGEQRRIEINAEELINQGRADLNIMLRPADVVLVPFAQRNRVYVSGAVAKPGPVEYLSSEGITVLQAITAAGGPSERGNLSNVKIVRTAADGTEERIEVNAKKIQKGKVADVALERNDTVIVGEWFF